MPQRGQAIPVDDAWRADAESRLKKKTKPNGDPWTRADLARAAKCSRSAVTHLLNGDYSQSPIVPRIEAVLGMTARVRKSTSEIEREISDLVHDLDETDKARVYERILAIRDERKRPR